MRVGWSGCRGWGTALTGLLALMVMALRLCGFHPLAPRVEAKELVEAMPTSPARNQAWVAEGTVPGSTPAERELARSALLHIRQLMTPNGGVVAARHTKWEYVWPRDGSWVVAALSVTGHHADAERVLSFFARAQRPDGTWDARYHAADASPVRDGRRWQLDANGWVPWATWFWRATQPRDDARADRTLVRLWPMVRAAADYAAESLDSCGLPPPSSDYWEQRRSALTLGTAAPLLAGLRAAADIAKDVGDPARAARYAAAAERLDRAIEAYFGPYGYPRAPTPVSGMDAAVTFLAPPFLPYDPEVYAQVRATAQDLTGPAGGIVPGQDWEGEPGLSWTPETAFFALAAAASGNAAGARHWLSWLADHRTEHGALSEKVSASGRPVGVAPLAWSEAGVVLAVAALEHPLPTPP